MVWGFGFFDFGGGFRGAVWLFYLSKRRWGGVVGRLDQLFAALVLLELLARGFQFEAQGCSFCFYFARWENQQGQA